MGETRNQALFSKHTIAAAQHPSVAFCLNHPVSRPLLDYITSGPVVALELITTDAVKKWRTTLGPTDSQEARNVAPDSIRALFGKDKQSNAGHGSDSDISAIRVSGRPRDQLLGFS